MSGTPYIPDRITMMGKILQWFDGGASLNTPMEIRLSRVGHQVMDQGLPPYADLALAGKVFSLSPGVVANAVAPVQDQPTTASAYTLVNNNPAGSNIFLLPIKIAARSASGTMGLGASLIAGAPNTPQSATVASTTGVTGPTNHRGDSTSTSKATLATGVTLAATPAWVDLAGRDTPAAVEIGAAIVAEVYGMWAIPPGFYGLGMHILAPAGTSAKFSIGVQYAEVKVSLA